MKHARAFLAAVALAGTSIAMGQPIPLWDWTFSRLGNVAGNFEAPSDMAVDGAGNVVVVGTTGYAPSLDNPSLSRADWTVVKYAASGRLLWWRSYRTLASGVNYPRSVAIDAGGNIYVAGVTWDGAGPGLNARLVAYNPDGAPLWTRVVDGGFDSFDGYRRVRIDDAGDLITVGAAGGTAGQVWLVEKRRRLDGALIWERRFAQRNAPRQEAVDVGFDANRNIFVFGELALPARTHRALGLMKLSPGTGLPVFTRTYAGVDSQDAMANRLSVYPSGQTVFSGAVVGPGFNGLDTAVVSHRSDGVPLWDRRWSFGIGRAEVPRDLAVDAAGNVYVSGGSFRPGDSLSNITLLKFRPSGSVVYETSFSSAGVFNDEGRALSVDALGFVNLLGTFGAAGVGRTHVHLGIDPVGRLLWSNTFGTAAFGDYESLLARSGNELSLATAGVFGASGIDWWTLRRRLRPLIASVAVSPTPVVEGSPATLRVRLNQPAPSEGQTILFSENSPFVAGIPSLTIPSGAQEGSVRFDVAATASPAPLRIVASTGTHNVSIDVPMAYRLAGFSATPGQVLGGRDVLLTVTLAGPAGAGGASVGLSSSSSSITVPATVTVPAGATSRTLAISTRPVPGVVDVTLTASLGATRISRVVRLVPPVASSLTISPSTVRGGTPATGQVVLSGRTAQATVVRLADNSPFATVPATVTVPAGADRASFRIATVAVTARQTAIVTATLGTAVLRQTLTITP